MTDVYARESGAPSYRHSFHAGNIGDVWKHLVLAHVIASLQAAHPKLCVLDCHAGEGEYVLKGRGEWGEGIGRLLDPAPGDISATFRRYLDCVQARLGKDGGVYPGSPVLLQALLRSEDALQCCELDAEAFAALDRVMAGRAQCTHGDGLAALDAFTHQHGEHPVVILDPPWTAKAEWTQIPERLARFCARVPEATALLWYPIKSYTRVAAMIKRLKESGMAGVVLDLITTPLEHQRNRLNGSGMLLCNVPTPAIAAAAGDGVLLAEAAAVFAGAWECRVQAWGTRD